MCFYAFDSFIWNRQCLRVSPRNPGPLPGSLLFLLGKIPTQYRMRDGVRSIDYLLAWRWRRYYSGTSWRSWPRSVAVINAPVKLIYAALGSHLYHSLAAAVFRAVVVGSDANLL